MPNTALFQFRKLKRTFVKLMSLNLGALRRALLAGIRLKFDVFTVLGGKREK